MSSREYMRDYMRRWRAANPEKNREGLKRWREAHPEKARENSRQWKMENPDRRRAHSRKRRAIKQSQIGEWSNDAVIEFQLFQKQQGLCSYCPAEIDLTNRSTFHLEHRTPLSRGGLHCVTNVVLACPSCNLSKGSKTAEEFRPEQYA